MGKERSDLRETLAEMERRRQDPNGRTELTRGVGEVPKLARSHRAISLYGEYANVAFQYAPRGPNYLYALR